MTSENEICPICEEGELIDFRFATEFEHRGRTTTLMLHCANCTACGSDLASGKHMRLNSNLSLRFRAEVDYGAQAQRMSYALLHSIYDRNLRPRGKPAECWATKVARLRGRNRLPRGLFKTQLFI